MQITITNEQNFVEVDEKELKTVLRSLPDSPKKYKLSLVFVDDMEIAKLNERYLKHKGPTDVLAFPFEKKEGEIIVSGETALREATQRGIEPKGELLLYSIHGMLHLIGYDDKTEEESIEMHQVEKETLIKFGYKWDWDE